MIGFELFTIEAWSTNGLVTRAAAQKRDLQLRRRSVQWTTHIAFPVLAALSALSFDARVEASPTFKLDFLPSSQQLSTVRSSDEIGLWLDASNLAATPQIPAAFVDPADELRAHISATLSALESGGFALTTPQSVIQAAVDASKRRVAVTGPEADLWISKLAEASARLDD
jgi:hypothetical protein